MIVRGFGSVLPGRIALVAMAAVGLIGGLLAPSVALGLTSPTTWNQAAMSVNFPVYQPTEALGLELSQVGVYPCEAPPLPRDRISAVYGTAKHAFFSVSEESPQVCGNGEESRVVRKAKINGVRVGVEVVCGRTRRCKVKVRNGFKNGFQLRWGQQGTIIEIFARHIALKGVLRVARGLTQVQPQPAA